MAETVIKTEKLGFSYEEDGKKVPVLHDVDLEIERGSFTCILGHNGSGKSTLAKLLSLVLSPSSGKVVLFGKNTDGITEDEAYELRRRVGMVFQNPDNQLVATVVEEDVAFGPENLGIEPSEIRKRVDDALELVGMSEYKKHSPHRLSGGQKQRVAIAGIIALDPDVIIFDESTAMLDPIGRAEVMETIKKLAARGTTVILITHYMEEAAEADRAVVLDDGRITADGKPEDVFSMTGTIEKAGLEIPQVTRLLKALKSDGINVDTRALTPQGAAEAIKCALGGRK
jgi:energy-coupling factor transport system ATP-binding protein